MSSAKQYVCRCFFIENYFVKKYGVHLKFENKEQIIRDYKQILFRKGCQTDEDYNSLIQELRKEKERRLNLGFLSMQRKALIKNEYKCLHPHVYSLQESYLSKDFVNLVNLCKIQETSYEDIRSLVEETSASEVFRIPVFNERFCQDFIEELCHFENSDMPKGRPNTMNNYGVLLSEMGFDPGFLEPLRTNYLEFLCQKLFPKWTETGLDSHKAFVVKYKLGEDLDLGYHYDNAEVTINVSLGKIFTSGNLFFGDMKDVPLEESECVECEHNPTWGLLHRGQHMHGALPIQSGERYNLIIWLRASSVRNLHCPMCRREPEIVENEGYSDGFTADNIKTVNVCCSS